VKGGEEVGGAGEVRLLMGISDKGNNSNKIEVHLEEDTTSGGNYILFNKIHFRINKKNLFRVYSRDSWKKHGRWYGGL